MKLKLVRPEIISAFASFFILVYVLMLRPVIGVADNGDFARIMGSTGLHYITSGFDERYFGYVNREYGVGIPIPFGGGYFSTEIFIVALAVYLSQSVIPSGIFDIRYLSFVYLVVFLAALFLIVLGIRKKWRWAGWLAAAVSVLVFSDMAYISYFNSFYGEAVTLVFLLLTAGAGIFLASSGKPRLWVLILFFLGAAFFAGAKVQNSPAGLLAVLLGFSLTRLRKDTLWKRTVVISAACVIAVSVLSYITISRDIKICNKYQTVFYGILKNSPDPAGDLRELGLNPEYKVLAGTNYFMKDYPVDIRTPEFKKEIDSKINHLKIAGFYLKHPERLLNKLEVAAFNGFKLKQGFGNYEKYPGVAYKTTANILSFWSNFKLITLPHTLLFTTVFFAGFVCVLVVEYLRNKDLQVRLFMRILAFITLTGILQFVLPVIGDGEADLSKHLFLFNVCFDLMFAAAIVYCICKSFSFLKIFIKYY
ncbi:MAG: hypothetical protein FIA99_04960 [Ruminiclostridium sp.]|nr:hypothetical protein [Ruminiclostridium sp.]